MFRSVRAQLTLWYCGVLAVVLIAFSIISYVLMARQIRENTDDSLADLANDVAAALPHDASDGTPLDVVTDFRYSDREILVLSSSGKIIARSRARTLTPDRVSTLEELVVRRGSGYFTIRGARESEGARGLTRPIELAGLRYWVVVIRSLAEEADRLGDARDALFLGIPVALLIASIGGYLLARKSLAPVLEMSTKARQIGADTLNERIPVRNQKDELGLLADTLNSLLSRLQESFDSQRRFMADASHELRTPISIMQGEADVTLSRSHRTEDEYRASLEIIQKASRKLTRVVQNLFLLARSDAGHYPIDSARFYLEEVVDTCVRSVRTIASAHNIEMIFRTATEMVMTGDEDLIHRMVLNLLDNALKYTRDGGRVSVTLERTDDVNVLTISDTGEEIPPAEQNKIFERFYRVDRARGAAGASGGAGLGLPIARWIAEMHGGSLRLARSSEEGSTFVVILPAADRAL